MPMAGGDDQLVRGTPVANALLDQAALSPDGQTLAVFLSLESQESRTYSSQIELISLDPDAGKRIRSIHLDPSLNAVFRNIGPPSGSGFHFTPDGKSLALVSDDKGVDNVWAQPLDGSRAHKLTSFTSQLIQDFRWSRDGKRLAVLRSNSTSDVILLHETGPPSP